MDAPAGTTQTGDRAETSGQEQRVFMGKVLIGMALAVAALALVLDVSQAPAASPHVHEGVEHVATHASGAIQVATEGIGTMLVGAALLAPASLPIRRRIAFIAASTLLYADGVVHWFAVSEHLSESPAYAGFFLAAGALQVFAIPLVLRRESAWWWIEGLLTAFFLDLYVVVLVAPAPFAFSPESLESLALVSKAIEIALLGAVASMLGPKMVPSGFTKALGRRPVPTILAFGGAATLLGSGAETAAGGVPVGAFLVILAILGLLALSIAIVRARPSWVAAGLTWNFVGLLLLTHAVYTLYFGSVWIVRVAYSYSTLAFAFNFFIACLLNSLLFAAALAAPLVLNLHALRGGTPSG